MARQSKMPAPPAPPISAADLAVMIPATRYAAMRQNFFPRPKSWPNFVAARRPELISRGLVVPLGRGLYVVPHKLDEALLELLAMPRRRTAAPVPATPVPDDRTYAFSDNDGTFWISSARS